MLLNDDLSTRTLVHAAALDWVPSPAKGVERRMLFRIGEEKARATSIVRYAPDSRFARHAHSGGEEFLVLEGTFQDETGDFPVAEVELVNPEGLELLVLAGGFTDRADTLDRWSWLRLPAGEPLHARVEPEGARVWFKSAPLLHEGVCAFEDEPKTEETNR
jgi:hypothetical protein